MTTADPDPDVTEAGKHLGRIFPEGCSSSVNIKLGLIRSGTLVTNENTAGRKLSRLVLAVVAADSHLRACPCISCLKCLPPENGARGMRGTL